MIKILRKISIALQINTKQRGILTKFGNKDSLQLLLYSLSTLHWKCLTSPLKIICNGSLYLSRKSPLPDPLHSRCLTFWIQTGASSSPVPCPQKIYPYFLTRPHCIPLCLSSCYSFSLKYPFCIKFFPTGVSWALPEADVKMALETQNNTDSMPGPLVSSMIVETLTGIQWTGTRTARCPAVFRMVLRNEKIVLIFHMVSKFSTGRSWKGKPCL